MKLSPNTLNSLLQELADWLLLDDCQPVEWVVCGGAALALQDLQSRTTRDVDVLCEWDGLTVTCIAKFPDEIKTCIQKVADSHPELRGLGNKWINLGPSKLARDGLPSGFEQRFTELKFGTTLTLQLLGREDLLALKLYAAADDQGSRREIHYHDLKNLKPTEAETGTAVEWIRTLPDFDEKRLSIQDTVRELGYDELTYYI